MENKSKLNTILLVVIIILLVVGLFYIISNNSKQKEDSLVNSLPQENQNNIEDLNNTNQPKDNETSLEIFKSLKAGYEISYPLNWPVVSKSEAVNYSNFQIKNSLDAVLPGANSNMRSNDSLISVQVSYGTLPNGINYTNYLTIDDVIKDPKFGVSKTDRLNNVTQMDIGGKDLRVLKLNNTTGMSYSFVYNGRVYNVNLMSGSQNQYDIDYKIFNEVLSSFVFL
jgi:hypothetical protein